MGRARPGRWRLLLLLLAAPAAAQTIATSPRPDGVSVTVYRNPDRSAADPLNLQWLNGYALITETRVVDIPAGEAAIRFEGVAGGILPESAIVSGLPDGVREKNQDALLLSPASLLDRSLGKRVRLRRTSPATGRVREEEAVVRTGANGAVVVETAAGVEALRCSGLPETLIYDRVPAGLSAKPTLSVATVSRAAHRRARVTLSYLAAGFDWQANYVATLRPDGQFMDLFAWVTLANGDETSFVRADTQAVAGRLNRTGERRGERPRVEPLRLACYPLGTTTSDLPLRGGYAPPPPPPAMMEMSVPASAISEEIIVTGSRVKRASLEELGDLKLYRIPEPVTVAAMSQKQVALLEKPGVRVATVYRRQVYPGQGNDANPQAAMRVFVAKNVAAQGLGVPLPSGQVAIFSRARAGTVLVGEGALEDRAVSEDVEIEAGAAPGVRSQMVRAVAGDSLLTVTNDRPAPVRFEADFVGEVAGAGTDARVPFERRAGRPLWRVTVPANGSATLRFRAKP